jgi:hypothetical protein
MRNTRRLLQLIGCMAVEIAFFAYVPVPWPFQMLAGAVVGSVLVLCWRRADNPKPRHARRRLGPPIEWIDR